MATNDRPASVEEKLNVRLDRARVFGLEFDETKERMVYGLPPVVGREPIFLHATADRQALVQREDIAGAKELEEAARKANAIEQQATIDQLQEEIGALKAKMAELLNEPPERKPPPQPARSATMQALLPDGKPNTDWTRNQIQQYAANQGYSEGAPPMVGGSKIAWLNYVLEQEAQTGE